MRASKSPRGDAARRAREPTHGIGDALRHRESDAGAEEDEEERREVDAAIQLVDLVRSISRCRSASGTVRIPLRVAGPHRRRRQHVRRRFPGDPR